MDVAQIGSMGLSTLSHEPVRLTNESEKCNEELEVLVMRNYRIFIENLTCSVELRVEDQKLSKVSGELNGLLSKLSSICSLFCNNVTNTVNSHKRNRKTLQHHMQLVELLEIPQLVDACARNDFYDEALELANFVNSLERRHLLAEGLKKDMNVANVDSNSNSCNSSSSSSSSSVKKSQGRVHDVIESIVEDVHKTLLALRSQLITQLAQYTSLSKALSILSTLRTLDSMLVDREINHLKHKNGSNSLGNNNSNGIDFDNGNGSVKIWSDSDRDLIRKKMILSCETRLQMEFIEARSANTFLDEEATRVVVSRNISPSTSYGMNDSNLDSPLKLSSSSASLGPYGKAIELLESSRTSWFAVVTQYTALFTESTSSQSSSSSSYPATGILSAWISQQVNKIFHELFILCNQIDEGAALKAVLEQGLFFGNRMSSVGCNFNIGLFPIFENIIINRFKKSTVCTFKHFIRMIEIERYDPSFNTNNDDTSSVHNGSNSNSNSNGASASATELSNRASREQVVPLYVYVGQNTTENENNHENNSDKGMTPKTPSIYSANAASSKSSSGGKDISAPSYLASYPPLAYWFNSLMTSLNLLRECPLISIKEDVSNHIRNTMKEFCEYLIQFSSHLKSKGAKYINNSNSISNSNSNSNSNGSTKGKNSGIGSHNSNESLDRLYARAVAQDLLPHTLFCFDSIYHTASTSTSVADALPAKTPVKQTVSKESKSNSGSNGSNGNGSLHVERLLDAQSALSKESYKTLQLCWNSLCDAGLISDSALTPSPVPNPKKSAAVI